MWELTEAEYDAFAKAYDKHWGFFADAIRPVLDRLALSEVSLGVPVLLASGLSGEGIDAIRERLRREVRERRL